MDSARTKTADEMVFDAPEVLGVLLMRFERDATALGDYLLKAEQDKKLRDVEYAIRNWALFQRAWTHEAATRLAKQYREMLVMRLAKPSYFKSPSQFTA